MGTADELSRLVHNHITRAYPHELCVRVDLQVLNSLKAVAYNERAVNNQF